MKVHAHHKATFRPLLFIVVALLLAVLVAGCATQEVPAEVADNFDEDVNSLILERQNLQEELAQDTPALAFYQDALDLLEANDIAVDVADDDALVITSAPTRVSRDLAVRLKLNISSLPSGSRMIATSEYASDVMTGEEDWQQASWSPGPSRDAFSWMYDLIADMGHSELYAAVE